MADTGVTGVCNWGVHENGVYWEECYCSQDSCNSAPGLAGTSGKFFLSVAVLLSAGLFRWLRD